MSLKQLMENVDKAKQHIDDIINEFGEFLISKKLDRDFLDYLKSQGDSHIRGVLDFLSTNSYSAEDILSSFSFSEKDQNITSKIVSHAKYKKCYKHVKYDVNGKFLGKVEILDNFSMYLENSFISDKTRGYVSSFIYQLHGGYILPAKQILDWEELVNYANEVMKEEDRGIIRLNPGRDLYYRPLTVTFIRRIINYALSGKKHISEVTFENILEFREKFMTSEGVDLSGLKEKLRETTIGGAFGGYKSAFSLLQNFLNCADPAKYDYGYAILDKKICATPKSLSK